MAVSVDRMATLGTLMMGAVMNEPYGPGFVIENVEPEMSSGSRFPSRGGAGPRR